MLKVTRTVSPQQLQNLVGKNKKAINLDEGKLQVLERR